MNALQHSWRATARTGPWPRRATRTLLTALVCLTGLNFAVGCELRVELGRAARVDGGPDGGGEADAGAPPDAGLDAGAAEVQVVRFAIEPNTLSQRQRGAVVHLELRNDSARAARLATLAPRLDDAAPAARGFTVSPAADNVAVLPANERATLRFVLDAATPQGDVPSSGEHRLCVALDLRDAAASALSLRVSEPSPCAAVRVQTPAALEVRLKAPPTLFQSETREAVLQLVNTGEASARALSFTLDAQAEGGPPGSAPWITLRVASGPAEVPGGATATATLAVSAALDAPLGVVLLAASVSSRDGNDDTRTARVDAAAERVRVRPVAKVAIEELTADRANLGPGAEEAQLSLRVVNRGLGDATLSELRLSMTDAAGADVTAAWSVLGTPLPREEPLAAGAAHTYVVAVRRERASQALTTTERVRGQLTVRTTERAETLEPPAQTERPWSFNFVPVGLEDVPVPVAYRAGARFGAALALLNDPEEGASIYAVGAPGTAPAGQVSVFVAPRLPLGVIDAPVGGDFGAAVAAVGHWIPVSTANRTRDLVVGAPSRDEALVVDPESGLVSPDDIPAATCAGCRLGSVVAGNPRGLRDADNVAQRLLLAIGAPEALAHAGRVDVVWQPRAGEAPSRALMRVSRTGAAEERFGVAIAIADIDGDGDPEVIVGAPGFRREGDTMARGRVVALRPPDYNTVAAAPWSRLEGEPGDELGTALANLGDIDGDGRADLALGAPGRALNGVIGAGRVVLISGATGAQLAAFDGNVFLDATGAPRGERFGAALARLSTDREGALVDFNGDGHPDFAVGAPAASPGGRRSAGAVYIVGAPPVAGLAGRVHARLDGAEPDGHYGAALSHLGDNDNDGYQDLLIGAPDATSLGQLVRGGRAEIARGRPFAPIVVAPRIEITTFDDGAVGQPPRRTVTRGGPTLPVRLELRNNSDAPLTNIRPELVLYREDGLVVGASEVTLTRDTPTIARLAQDERAEARFSVTVPETLPLGVYRLGARIETTQGTSELPEAARHLWIVQRPPRLRVLGLRLVRGNADRQFLSLGRDSGAEFLADVINTGDAALVGLQGEVVFTPSAGTSATGLRAEVEPLAAGAHVPGGEVAVVAVRLIVEPSVQSGATGTFRLATRGADENTGAPVASDGSELAPQLYVASRATVRVLELTTTQPRARAGDEVPLRVSARFPFDPLAPADATLVSEALHLEPSRGTGWLVSAPRPLASIPMCAATTPCAGTLFEARVTVPLGLTPGPVSIAPRFGALDTRAHPLGVYVEGGPDADLFPAGALTLDIVP